MLAPFYNCPIERQSMIGPRLRNRKKNRIIIQNTESNHQQKAESQTEQKAESQPTLTETQTMIDYDTTDEMGDLLIPAFLQHQYINNTVSPITKLRTWQTELLGSKSWENQKNCVAVAPTSGGKTLIAEVAIAQLLEDFPHAKAIYALPFVALAAEKTLDFEHNFSEYSVRPFFQNVGNSDFYRGSIAICTFEKCHSLLNSAIKGKYDNKIKLVVIDEVHMISDETRGVTLESLIMKLISMRHPPRIIALTATLNECDANNLAKKINGFTYFSTKRSTNLKKYISTPEGILYRIDSPSNDGKNELNHNKQLVRVYQAKSIKEDTNFLIPMVRTNLLKSQNASVLIFVNTRNETKQVALFLLNHYDAEIEGVRQVPPMKESTLQLRNELIRDLAKSPAGIDPVLVNCFKKGIAYHHAGLLLEERKIIENGLRNGALSIVVATTTLSAGVNIRNVSRVIIYSPYRYFNSRKSILPESLFAQMAGRSGRTEGNYNINNNNNNNISHNNNGGGGDVVIISRSQLETKEIFEHISKPLPSIVTTLSATEQIDTYVLQALSLGLASDIYTIKDFLKSSFHETEEFVIKGSIERLNKNGLLENYRATLLGNAISTANVSVEDGLTLNVATKQLMGSICLIDDLHLIYLCTPLKTGLQFPSFQEPIWEEIFESHSHVITLITGQSREKQKLIIIRSFSGRCAIEDRQRPIFEKIFGACILSNVVEEVPMNEIEKKYNVDRGSVQMLQSSSASFAGQATKFCETMGYHPLAAALQQFTRRLSFGVKGEIIDLMAIPSMRKEIARALFDRGYTTPVEVAELTAEEMTVMLGGGNNDDVNIENKRNEENSNKNNYHFNTIGGLDESDILELTKRIVEEARALAEHLAIIEDLEEEATWRKLQVSESDDSH